MQGGSSLDSSRRWPTAKADALGGRSRRTAFDTALLKALPKRVKLTVEADLQPVTSQCRERLTHEINAGEQ
jgi:hypothetical protein